MKGTRNHGTKAFHHCIKFEMVSAFACLSSNGVFPATPHSRACGLIYQSYNDFVMKHELVFRILRSWPDPFAITFGMLHIQDFINTFRQGCPIRRCNWNLAGTEAPLRLPFKCCKTYRFGLSRTSSICTYHPGYRSMISSIDIYCSNIKPCTYSYFFTRYISYSST